MNRRDRRQLEAPTEPIPHVHVTDPDPIRRRPPGWPTPAAQRAADYLAAKVEALVGQGKADRLSRTVLDDLAYLVRRKPRHPAAEAVREAKAIIWPAWPPRPPWEPPGGWDHGWAADLPWYQPEAGDTGLPWWRPEREDTGTPWRPPERAAVVTLTRETATMVLYERGG
jgi:hypothetical protein